LLHEQVPLSGDRVVQLDASGWKALFGLDLVLLRLLAPGVYTIHYTALVYLRKHGWLSSYWLARGQAS
jgi:hypothetical protein